MTGATGFLGSQLARRLVAAGCGVVVLKRSFSDTRRIADLLASGTVAHDIDVRPLATPFLEHPIDCVLHCATDYGRRESTSAAIIEANLLLPLQLLELAVEHRVPCFINTDTKLDKRINAYSLSKRQFREWLATFADATTAVNVPLEHFYGPGDDRTKFVSSMIGRMLSPDRSIALTGGDQLRDFIHVDDVVEAFVRIVERCVLEARPPAPPTAVAAWRGAHPPSSNRRVRQGCTVPLTTLGRSPCSRRRRSARRRRRTAHRPSALRCRCTPGHLHSGLHSRLLRSLHRIPAHPI